MNQLIKDYLSRQVVKRLCLLIRKYVCNAGVSTSEFTARLDQIPDGFILHAGVNFSVEIYRCRTKRVYHIFYRSLLRTKENRLIGCFEFVEDSGSYHTSVPINKVIPLLKDLFLLIKL